MSSEKKPQPIKRFQDVFDPETTSGWKMEADPAGEWVRYSDHEATIEALRAERDEALRHSEDADKAWSSAVDAECAAVNRAEAAEARVAQLEAERNAEAKLARAPWVSGISLEVAANLLETFGGDDTDMTLAFIEDGHSGAGFYAWCTEYPEDGSTFVGKASEFSLLSARALLSDGGAK